MAVYRTCKACGDLHDIYNWPDNHREWVMDNRSDLAAPMIIRDGMDAVKSMLDGQMYDSKSRLRRTYKDAGVIEVGNDSSYTDPEKLRSQAPTERKRQKQASRRKVEAAVGKALSQAGFGA
jgi:hypothetical protein